jgi:hypothetical protein
MNAECLVASESPEEVVIASVHMHAEKAVFGGISKFRGHGFRLDRCWGLEIV